MPIARVLRGERDFRWRGGDVSRLEALSDAVFAFALTLLVVSLEVPKSYAELATLAWSFPGFAVCFVLLLVVWFSHYQWHRRYGLEDLPTVWINGLLLLLVLFYVYPLKALFTALVAGLLGLDAGSITVAGIDEANGLMIFYGAGFAGIFSCFALLTWRAWRLRDSLELDARERAVTLATLRGHLIYVASGLLSVVLAAGSVGGTHAPLVSGLAYPVVLFPAHFLNGWISGRRIVAMRPKDADRS